FYVVDLGIVGAQLARWRAAFPRVVPYYAIKCNPDPVIVRTLASLGCNFDCASRGEIEIVQQVSRGLPSGIPKPEIVYANPCKGRGHIIDAVCRGVRMMTFDNVAEVQKCAAVSRKIQLIMRIITDDSGSQCRLSSKFGAPKQHWPILLAEAKKFGLEVVGVSFHVGSGCRDATRYEMALKDCKELFEVAKRDYGFDMNILDIGGGFPGETHNKGNQYMYFNEIAAAVAPMLDELFPPSSGVKLIAEPGRYLVAASSTLVASVVSVREAAVSGIVRQAIADSVQPLQDDFAYYINDGVYGAFNNLLFDHATVVDEEADETSPQDETLYPSTVFGPTCDSMDVLSRGVLLPKMAVGDWMYFQNMGAYTSAAASTFNGFPTTEKFYVCS
ncbi:ornithine decarboxylase, partial [Thalassiosira pseudonana CCMP1335]